MNTARFHSAFREVRSLVNRPTLSAKERGRVWNILKSVQPQLGEAYEAEWLPYLRSFPQHWEAALAKLNALHELERAVSVAPFAKFDLHLTNHRIHQGQLLKYLERPAFSHVRHLEMHRVRLGAHEIRALAKAPKLESLRLMQVGIQDMDLSAFGEPGALPALRTLLLDQPHASNMRPLRLEGEGFATLERLRVRGTFLTPEALAPLEQTLPRLRHLELHGTSLNVPDLEVMSAWQDIALETLELTDHPFGDAGVHTLMQAPWLEGLRGLGVWECHMGRQGLSALANADTLRGLLRLRVHGYVMSLIDNDVTAMAHVEHPCLVHRGHPSPPEDAEVTDMALCDVLRDSIHSAQQQADAMALRARPG